MGSEDMNTMQRKTVSASLRFFAASLGLGLLLCGSCGTGSQAPAKSSGQNPGAALPQFETLSIRWMRANIDGRQSEAGALVRPLREFRDKPVSLLIRRTQGEGDGNSGPAHFEQRFEVGAERIALPPSDVDCSSPATCTAKEWLELELQGPGVSRRVNRPLYVRGDEERVIPGYRRYTIVAVPDAVGVQEVEQRVERAHAELGLDARKSKVEAIASESENAPENKARALLSQLDEQDPGGPLGHLVALGFAAQSDIHTERLARTMAVTVRREVPRVLITTAESENEEGKASVSLDLRLDEVAATSESGPVAARLFQMARGMQESMLEGMYFKGIAGEQGVVCTALLMNEARKNEIDTVLLGASNRAEIESLGLPSSFAALVGETLDRGHHVILPRSAVELAGAQRWGFWDIDPATGATIGVMEGGQHQVMVEIPTMNKEVSLNPRMGFFLGMHAGTIQGWFAYSALMLKYGELTPQLIAELKAMLKDSACSACPELNLNAEATIKMGEDCYKAEIEKVDVVKFEFCEKYGEGFKCAIGLLIASLTGGDQLPIKPDAEIKLAIGCTTVSSKGEE